MKADYGCHVRQGGFLRFLIPTCKSHINTDNICPPESIQMEHCTGATCEHCVGHCASMTCTQATWKTLEGKTMF